MPQSIRLAPLRALIRCLPLAVLASASAAGQPAAEVELFEWLPAFNPAFVGNFVMNNHGDFAGRTTAGVAIWVNGQVSPSFGAVTSSILPSTLDMNDSPTAVGIRPAGGSLQASGFRLDGPASFMLGTSGAEWTGINNAGTIVGRYFANSSVHPGHAFRISSAGDMTILEQDFRPRGIDAEGRIYGLNNAGNTGFFMKNGAEPIVNLGSFGGDFFQIHFVSEQGDFAGEVLNDQGASSKAFAYIDGEGHVYPRDPDALTAVARSVTRAGQVVGMDFTNQLPRPVWVQRGETRSMLRDLAAPVLGYTPNIEFVVAGSERGWILGLGIDPSVNELRLFRCKLRDEDPDRDGDGLPNDWEINGVPFTDAKGVERRYMLPGADPDRKDLYVEVDSGIIPFPQESAALVVAAFAQAPVSYPDGTSGITLHVLLDETNIALNADAPTNDFPSDFYAVREDHFGTVLERGDPDAGALLEAKAKAFRYCVAYDGLAFPNNSGGYLGIADLHGANFVIDMAAANAKSPIEDAAATFMHELGHTLDLDHGGYDGVQGKPNYVSIMNYTMANRLPYNSPYWRLDFSREELPTINEVALDEAAGIQSSLYRSTYMPYGVGPEESRSFRLVKLSGTPTDFDYSGEVFGLTIQDLNFIGPDAMISGVGNPSPEEELFGYNDWANLRYEIPRATLRRIALGCPSPESILFLEQNVPQPCVADINGDTFVGFADLNEVVSRFNTTAGEALFDAAVDIDYDGQIGFSDLNMVVSQFNTVCPGGMKPCKEPEPTLGGDPCGEPTLRSR